MAPAGLWLFRTPTCRWQEPFRKRPQWNSVLLLVMYKVAIASINAIANASSNNHQREQCCNGGLTLVREIVAKQLSTDILTKKTV